MNDSENKENSIYSIKIWGYLLLVAVFAIVLSVTYCKSASKIFIGIANTILFSLGLVFWHRIIKKAKDLHETNLFSNENRINNLIKHDNIRIRELFDFQKQAFFDQFSESYAFYSNILIMSGMVSSAIFIFWNLSGNLSSKGENNITKILNIAPEIFIFTAMALIYAMILSSLAKYLRGKIFFSSFEFVNQILKDIESSGGINHESDRIYQALSKVVDEKIVTNLNNLATNLSETLTNVMDKKIVSDLKSLISNFSKSTDNSTKNIEKIGNSINSLDATVRDLKSALNETADEIDSYVLNAKNASIAVNNLTIHLTSLTEKLEGSVNYLSGEMGKIVLAFNQLNEDYLKKMVDEIEKHRKSLMAEIPKMLHDTSERLRPHIEELMDRLLAHYSQNMTKIQQSVLKSANEIIEKGLKENSKFIDEIEISIDKLSRTTEGLVGITDEIDKSLSQASQKWPSMSNKIVSKGFNPITESLQQLIYHMELLEKETSPNQKLFLDSVTKIAEDLSQINSTYKKIHKETCALEEIKGILVTTEQLHLS